MKKLLVIHPFLFSIFPILFLYSHNIEQLSFSEPLVPTVIVLCFTLLLVLLSRRILKDSQKAGIFVSIFLVLFFSYGHAYDMIAGFQIDGFKIGRHRYLLLSWGILFAFGAYLTMKTHKDLRTSTIILNIVAFSLVVISIINIGVYKFKTKYTWQGRETTAADLVDTSTLDSGDASRFRDIYYIILDGYASSRTLKEIYNFDNTEFGHYLTGKGFHIASESRSNYALTFLSLASSLNMEYVNYLTDMVELEKKDRTVPYQMIENSKVMNFLKFKGYKFIHFSSGWGATNYNKYADLNIQCGKFHGIGNEFLMMLIKTTMLRPFQSYLIGDDARARVLCTFSELAELHRIKGPKFVFAHVISPHPPYVFGANGEPTPETDLKMSGYVWGQKENYLNQLIFVSKKVERLVDEILSRSEVPPIIILQADHGTASTFTHPDSDGWERPTEKMLRERTRIFNAYYLPLDGNKLLYDSVTPVNTFRLIFNFYFNTDYELLDDLIYYSTYENPYKLVNVTDKVKYD